MLNIPNNRRNFIKKSDLQKNKNNNFPLQWNKESISNVKDFIQKDYIQGTHIYF